MDLVASFREQARACGELGSPMYAELLGRAAEDLEQRGVCAEVLAGHEEDPGPSALALRLMGSVHRLVLSGSAPELAAYYPSAGGTWRPEPGWRAFQALLRAQPAAVRVWLESPPQTNEVGRSAALMGGLLWIGESYRHPLRLFEIGSSGGLNLHADRFCFCCDDGTCYGAKDSPVRLSPAWRGALPTAWPGLRVVERLGSDALPVDVTTEQGRTTLLSYVWPDQRERLERLSSAFSIAERRPVEVRRQRAPDFVRDIVLVPDTTTVLWHSVVWQYLAPEEQAAVTRHVERLGTQATSRSPFAHLFLEPTRRTPGSKHEFLVVLRLWPGGRRTVLGSSGAHGIPTIWD